MIVRFALPVFVKRTVLLSRSSGAHTSGFALAERCGEPAALWAASRVAYPGSAMRSDAPSIAPTAATNLLRISPPSSPGTRGRDTTQHSPLSQRSRGLCKPRTDSNRRPLLTGALRSKRWQANASQLQDDIAADLDLTCLSVDSVLNK